MYKEIENILVRTLSPFEYEQLEELKQTYNEEQIINAYKNSSIKNINYIKKILQNRRYTPNWLHQEIKNEVVDKQTKKEYDEFMGFIEVFRK